MPDPQLIPPGRHMERIPPDVAALPAILDAASRRRTRRAVRATSAAMVTVIAVAAGFLQLGGTSTETLDVVPAEPAPSVDASIPERDSTKQERAHTLSTGTRPVPVPVPAKSSGATAVARSDRVAPRPSPAAVHMPMPMPAPGRAYDAEAVRSSGGAYLQGECHELAGAAQSGWCVSTAVQAADAGGYDLVFEVCREHGSRGPGLLAWETTQEVDFAIGQPGAVRWSHDPDVAPRSASEMVVSGRCLFWVKHWSGQDEQGRPLPPGHYTLWAWSTSTEPLPRASTPFGVPGS